MAGEGVSRPGGCCLETVAAVWASDVPSHLCSVPTLEHDDRVSFPQRRKKGRGPFRWKPGEGNRRSGRGGAGIRSSRLEEDDRDVAMSDAQDVPRVR